MRKWIGRFFAAIGVLTVLTCGLFITLAIMAGRSKPKVATTTVLEFDLEQGLVEMPPDDPIAKWMGSSKTSIHTVLEALRRGKQDGRVKGLVIRLGNAQVGLAHTQELRDAVLDFRKQGKWAIAFAETFGEFGPGNGNYYLATACDEIYVQPSGDVGLTGLAMETLFFRGALDKLGVVPQLDHRKDFKTAMNQITEKKMTPAHRESMQSLASDLYAQLVAGIAEGRHLTEKEVRALVDQGPFSAAQAVKARLVDGTKYRDELNADVKQKAGAGAELLYLANYLDRLPEPAVSKEKIALIYGVGNVTRGKSTPNPFAGGSSMGSDTLVSAFHSAAHDKDVKAIVFRIDSPGGSYVASDTIWRAVAQAKAQGKRVVVSMANVAGSGGYFVAMPADKIVAEPATLTGSIGVFAGKAVVEKLLSEKLGISQDEVHEGKNALIWSNTRLYSDAEWKKIQAFLDSAYADFVHKAAQGRGMTDEALEKIAQGRVWTGKQAKEVGLVDELGGMDVAVRLAKQLVGVPESTDLEVEVFPKPKNPLDQILQRLRGREGSSSEQEAALRMMLETARPLIKQAQKLGVGSDQHENVLAMPLEIEPVR